MLHGLFTWWRRSDKPASLPGLKLVMYTRRECHLCLEAWQQLSDFQRRHGFTLEAVDVDTDPELAARHGALVPVVTVNGKVRFRGRVNRVLLTRLLRAESRRIRSPE